MLLDISVLIIAITMIVLTIFTTVTLLNIRKSVKSVKRDFHHLSTEAVTLIRKLDALTVDLKSKSESLNFVFQPLKSLSKEKHSHSGTVDEVVDWVVTSLSLVNKIRACIKHYEK